MRLEEDTKLDFKDVLIRPKRSTLTSRSEVDLTRTFDFKASGQSLTTVPLIASNMDGVGTMAMARAFLPHKMLVALHKYYSVNELKDFFESLTPDESPYAFYTMGIKERDVERLDALLAVMDESRIASICIDVANGYTERFVQFATRVRQRFPEKILMAGNVVTGEMVEELSLAGVDIIKVGIGPGSVCTTRKMTGVGYPQLSAVIECADAAHGIGARICSDGGCQVPGDVAKAFGAGADFVMMGSMFAGHEESEMERFIKNGKEYLKYYGSSRRRRCLSITAAWPSTARARAKASRSSIKAASNIPCRISWAACAPHARMSAPRICASSPSAPLLYGSPSSSTRNIKIKKGAPYWSARLFSCLPLAAKRLFVGQSRPPRKRHGIGIPRQVDPGIVRDPEKMRVRIQFPHILGVYRRPICGGIEMLRLAERNSRVDEIVNDEHPFSPGAACVKDCL